MKTRGSGSGMFLIEILLALMIFAIASAICLQVFVTAHNTASESSTLNSAVVAAQNGAECFKAVSGDLSAAAKLLKNATVTDGDTLTIRFDKDWQPVSSDAFYYILNVKRVLQQGALVTGEVTISDNSGGIIFSIPVSAMEVTQ
jgi:type II secretory pathway pseudopilin PulG